ncbi:MAG: AAA family ATPase [Cycloclasticus sp.]
MYLEYFGLKKQPFGITPDTSLFFKGAERGDILDAILYALNSGEGIIKVVGEVGSGKTMLSRMLTKKASDNTVFVFLLNPSIQAEQVLYAIAYDLGVDVDESKQSIQVLHLLQKKLFEIYENGKKVVLIIDEAQQMPLTTLEEVRLLSNLETETEKLLQIIMFGQPELDEHIDTPSIRQLRERITYSFYLSPLTHTLVETYLAFRLKKAGHQGRGIFKQRAIKSLTKSSHGTLRRLNVLADKALLAAFLDQKAEVDSKHVKMALQDGAKGQKQQRTGAVAAVLSVIAVLLGVGVFYWLVQFEPNGSSMAAKRVVQQVPIASSVSTELLNNNKTLVSH